jgi:biotin carboxylase
MQHRLVIIGSLYENIDLVMASKKRGYYTIVCDGYSFGPCKALGDKAYNIDVRNVDRIAQMCIDERADGITGSFSDLIFEKVTEISAKAGLKWYVKPEMLKYYRDKSEAKKLLKKLGVRVPENKLITPDFDTGEISDMNFPIVVKPVSGWGSKGIFVAEDINELRKFAEKTAEYSENNTVEAEEYNSDEEFNITSFVIDGNVHVISCGHREKSYIMENTVPQVARIFYPPKRAVRTDIIEAARDTLQKFRDHTGQHSGVLSMQCFYGENGLSVGEIAGRVFAYEHDLIDRHSGLSVPELLLDTVYDEEHLKKLIMNNNFESETYNMRLYYFGRDGMKIKNMDKVTGLCRHEALTDNLLFYNEGDIVDNNSYKSYFATFSVQADTKEKLDDITDYFRNEMSVMSSDGDEVIRKKIK